MYAIVVFFGLSSFLFGLFAFFKFTKTGKKMLND